MVLTEVRRRVKIDLPILYGFLTSRDYIAVAAVKKAGDQTQLYFLKHGDSSSEIAAHLRDVPALEYADISLYVEDEVPIWREGKNFS